MIGVRQKRVYRETVFPVGSVLDRGWLQVRSDLPGDELCKDPEPRAARGLQILLYLRVRSAIPRILKPEPSPERPWANAAPTRSSWSRPSCYWAPPFRRAPLARRSPKSQVTTDGCCS